MSSIQHIMILVIKENIAKVANIFVQNVGLLVASSKIPPKLELRMYKKMLLNLMKTVHTGSNSGRSHETLMSNAR